MSWLESLIYGLISGIAEFLPISSQAHQKLLLHFFGEPNPDPVRDMLVHIALVLSVYSGCRSLIDQIRREQKQQNRSAAARIRNSRVIMDARLAKNATIPMIIGMLIFSYIFNTELSLLGTAGFLLINGLVLFAAGRMMQGNKDVRSMTYWDSLLMGVSAGFSAFPGVSRIACTTSVSISRGAQRQNALNWALLLSIPALIALGCLDVLKIFSGGYENRSFWGNFLGYILSALSAYFGGIYSIKLVSFLVVNVGFSGFSYYCWGASLFSFLMYLIVA